MQLKQLQDQRVIFKVLLKVLGFGVKMNLIN